MIATWAGLLLAIAGFYLSTPSTGSAMTIDDNGTLGYAVSADCHAYVLIGLKNRAHWAALLGPVEVVRPHQ